MQCVTFSFTLQKNYIKYMVLQFEMTYFATFLKMRNTKVKRLDYTQHFLIDLFFVLFIFLFFVTIDLVRLQKLAI